MKRNVLNLTIIIVCVLVVGSVILLNVFKKGIESKPKISDEEIKNSKNIHLEYTLSFSTAPLTYVFNVSDSDNSYKLQDSNEDTIVNANLTDNDIMMLKDALINGKVSTWDNFNRSNPNVLDGEMFSLNVKIDNTEIKAHGNNSFPTRYRQFYNTIYEIIKKYNKE